jgi:hypothetical protein
VSDVENLSRIANQIGTEIAKSLGFAGVVLAVLDYEDNLGISCSVSATANKTAMDGIARAIQHYSRHALGAELEVQHSFECVHCKQELSHSVTTIREHATTCPSSPVVRELAAAKTRIAQLEAVLADARCDKAEVAPVWTPAPRREG